MSLNASCFRQILLIVALLGIPRTLPATNILFLPSDAFIATELTEEAVKAIQVEPIPSFGYRGPEWIEPSFCGYAGYARLTYPEMPAVLRVQLRNVYDRLREDYPQQIEISRDAKTGERNSQEISGFLTLIYNADYDIEQFGLLVKFNENWPKEARGNRIVKTGFPGYPALGTVDAQQFAPFVNDVRFVMREWRFASEVPALKVRLPDMLDTEGSGYPRDPATVNGPVKFVIFPTDDLKNYDINKRYCIDDPLIEFFVVSAQDTERWELTEDDGWKAVKWVIEAGGKP